MPAALSANKLMGASVSTGRGDTAGKGCGDTLVDASGTGVEDAWAGMVILGLADGGLKTCMGRTTDCTTWGLSVALVRSGATVMLSSAETWCLRKTLKITSPAAN